jgi:hypothetical protein
MKDEGMKDEGYVPRASGEPGFAADPDQGCGPTPGRPFILHPSCFIL